LGIKRKKIRIRVAYGGEVGKIAWIIDVVRIREPVTCLWDEER